MDMKQIYAKALELANKRAKDISKKIAKELDNAAKQYIEEFYAEYQPQYYVRSDSLYKVHHTYCKKKGGIYWGGVELNAKHIKHDYYHTSPYAVVSLTLDDGYHSLPFQPKFPSVISKLMRYRDTISIAPYLDTIVKK